MALVQLKLGDMFDGPADLIVLPCSTSGTITSFVRERLIHHRIPYPKPGMKLGDVSILPFEGGENIAQFVAFAASVQSDSSSPEAIRRIGEQIGAASVERSTIRLISTPLLGAGAGKLPSEAVVSALSSGFKNTAHRDARLVVHVLHKAVFDRLSREPVTHAYSTNVSGPSEPSEPAIRVFMSYSHTSAEHEQWVENLGRFLRENGIDARLDIWHLRRGMDLPQFMTNELVLANRVVIVSDDRYAAKADGRVGGVGWETMIIQGNVAQQPPESTKYLVIVRSPNVDSGLPHYLKTKFVIHWPDGMTDERNRQTLIRELYNLIAAPPILSRPVFI
ncbi:MAG TPA: toll/interleukin-1 receptor domain-containing protein [Thermoanaerobaculia bacterium]|jgi:hypothetical protein|nr:toll/interleukin-1 receptor domain-containing protein [Thermoanaerobaculia bacterium]